MNPLAANPIAHALGWTLLHFCWQGAVVALLLWCVLGAMGTRSSQLRYAACCAALAMLVLFPLITFGHLAVEDYRLAALPRAPLPAIDVFVNASAGASALPWTLRVSALLDHSMPWLLAAWGIGVACLLFRLSLALIAARTLRTSGAAASAELERRFADLRVHLGISRAVQLLLSVRVEVPTVVGWLRPVVLLPASALSGLAPEQIEAVLCHELAHIRRHDYLVSVLQSVVETLLFYHPAVWWVSKQIRRERECCCDDFAVRAGGNVLAYARALALLEENRSLAPQLALAANGGVLKMRMQRLLKQPEASTGFQVTSVAVLILFAISALGIAGRIAWAETRNVRSSTIQSGKAASATRASAADASAPQDGNDVAGDAATVTELRADMGRLARLQDEDVRLNAQADALNRQEATYHDLLEQADRQPQMSDDDRKRLEDAAERLADSINAWADQLVQQMTDRDTALARFNSPELQRQMAEAAARFNSPEFKKQMADAQAALARLKDEDFGRQMAAMDAMKLRLNSEETQRQIDGAMAKLNSPQLQKQMEAARAALDRMNSPELRRRLEDAAKALPKIDPTLMQQQLRQLQMQQRQLALSKAPFAVEVPAPEPAQSASKNLPNGSIPANEMQGLLLTHENPVYPPIAKAAHVQGVVVLHAIISKEGKVMNLQVVSGPPMLIQSAIDAVQKWTYRPYTINGEPIEVETTINVNYSLAPPDMSCTYYQNGVGREGTCEGSNGNYSCRANDDKGLVQQQIGCEWKVQRLQDWQQGSLSADRFQLSVADSQRSPRIFLARPTNTENGTTSTLPSTDAAGNPVRKIGDGIVPPMIIHQVPPQFSAEAKAAKYSGKVIVGCIVNQQGRPEDVRVIRGVGMGLDEKAREAVRQYTFKPAMQNGSPVSVALNIEVDFRSL